VIGVVGHWCSFCCFTSYVIKGRGDSFLDLVGPIQSYGAF
jgi:hypothetical protein